jgi:hypothetical protein
VVQSLWNYDHGTGTRVRRGFEVGIVYESACTFDVQNPNLVYSSHVSPLHLTDGSAFVNIGVVN